MAYYYKVLNEDGSHHGGEAKTDAKKSAARENGKLGGRPRKEPADS